MIENSTKRRPRLEESRRLGVDDEVGIFGRTLVRSDGAIGDLDWKRLVSSRRPNADGTEAPPNLRARCRGVRMRVIDRHTQVANYYSRSIGDAGRVGGQ